MTFKKLALLSVLGAMSSGAMAADGDITFNGEITSSACTLEGFNGAAATSGVMDLSPVSTSAFSTGNLYAGMTDFTIDLKGCTTTTVKNAQVKFSGTPDPADGSILKNISTDVNPATGVGIAILENNGSTPIDINGVDPSEKQLLTTGKTALKFKVAYKANTSTPSVGVGKVTAKSFIDIVYN
ncbi:fimbrial protein [Buttiauxella selenatireducens]|uniref:Fimbrial protein n=1 Tax=Buttiauxella selenatireducens TaxID=3073902 RepID=A0ABY9S7P6_9ENTR|nr:fimbrial protein [Buttiauxella sp. R73]WMY73389.1 fimbrial protein [Buttiauxella sp. R73]